MRVSGVECRVWEGERGFTLIELLVTIGIIAILASILLPAMNAALKRADMAKARQDMSQIVGAVKTFYSEYGGWPCPDDDDQGSEDYTYGGKGIARKQNEVINILRAVDTTNNPKRIAFLEVPDGVMSGTDKDGNTYVNSEGYYLDPWENPYIICMDADFNGEMEVSDAGTPAQNYADALSPAGDSIFPAMTVGVMSYGEDHNDTNAFLVSWDQ